MNSNLETHPHSPIDSPGQDHQQNAFNSAQQPQPQPEYQQDYEQDNQDGNLQIIIEQKIPHQQVVSLVHHPEEGQNQKQNNQYRSDRDDSEQKSQLVGKLKIILNAKVDEIKERKRNIQACKREIKEIGEQVDKEMNKSLIRHSKPYANVNIQSIFQAPKTSDPQLNELTAELAKIRLQSKKIKSQLKSVETQVMAPVNLINFQRATQIRSKIKEADLEIKKIREEKEYLELELKMMGDLDGGDQGEHGEEVRGNRERNGEILALLKEEKNLMYELQKEDRTLTEKIRFIEQLQQQLQYKKQKSSTSAIPPKQLEPQIHQLLQQINELLQKRNKIQTERKNIYKSLQTDVAGMEGKNWQLIGKLREIDARLLKHYNSKVRKARPRKDGAGGETTFFQEVQRPKEKIIESSGTTIKTIYRQNIKNDKNLEIIDPEPVILIQKRKNYEFFMTPTENQQLGNIILSDEMLGNKLSITRLNFLIDEHTLYGISAEYQNQHGFQVQGYKIMSRIKPKDLLTKTLLLTKNEVLNYIQIGIDAPPSQSIKFLHLITSEAKEFKWGNLQLCHKSEQKNIRKYENIVVKGKLNQIGERDAPNYYALGGIGFSVVYLAAK